MGRIIYKRKSMFLKYSINGKVPKFNIFYNKFIFDKGNKT